MALFSPESLELIQMQIDANNEDMETGNVATNDSEVQDIENKTGNSSFWDGLFGFGSSVANNAGTLGGLFSPSYRDFTLQQREQQQQFSWRNNLAVIIVIAIVLILLIVLLTRKS